MAWLAIKDAAKYLHTNSNLMYALVELGEVPAYEPIIERYGGRHTAGSNRRLVNTEDLDAFMRQNPAPGRRQYEREEVKEKLRVLIFNERKGMEKRRAKASKEGTNND